MTYVRSLADVLGYGTVISIGPVAGTSSPTYTAIGEPISLTLHTPTRKTIATTNFNSIAGSEEFLAGSIDYGEFSFEANRIGNDAGQLALLAALSAGALYMFKVALPIDAPEAQTTAGDMWAFNGLVTSVSNGEVSVDKVTTIKATIKISGQPVFTAGS
jgi:hypothetical protein